MCIRDSCWGEVRFFPVMLALILINYLCGLGLEAFDAKPGVRKVCLLYTSSRKGSCASAARTR